MRRGWFALAVFGAVVLSLSAMPIESVIADDPTSEVVARINQIRAQHGLGPLVIQSQLVASAQAYAGAMARGGFFGHTAPNGSTMVTRNEAAGYTGWNFLEENIASGQSSVADVVNAWMQSAVHRNNLLSPAAHDTGVGFVHVPGSRFGYYWVEEFGMKIGAAPVPSKDPIASPTVASTVLPVKVVPRPANPVVVPKSPAVQPVLATPTPLPVVTPPSTILVSQTVTQPKEMRAAPYRREQRDPDNLNLYLIQYQNLGNDHTVATRREIPSINASRQPGARIEGSS